MFALAESEQTANNGPPAMVRPFAKNQTPVETSVLSEEAGLS
jgi:hypothetical protein